MTVRMLIEDGPAPYWWESAAIWVVPGSDPNGPAGAPIAGENAYLWAHVANLGNAPVLAARVDFFWANPAAEIRVGIATPIGSAYVDLGAAEAVDVLCLVPWVPVIVNDGHECVVATVHAAGDTNPIPDPLPNGYLFDPPAHEQIAQRNLNVVEVSPFVRMLTLTINGSPREEKISTLTLEFDHELEERVLSRLGLRGLKPARKGHVAASLSDTPGCREGSAGQGQSALDVRVGRGKAAAAFLSIHAPSLPDGEYQVVRVVERRDKQVLGGVSYVIVNKGQEKKGKKP